MRGLRHVSETWAAMSRDLVVGGVALFAFTIVAFWLSWLILLYVRA